MKIGTYFVFFFLSTIKFLFTPFAGPAAGLNYIETYICCVSGGIFSAAIFYFASEFFIKRAHHKRVEQIKLAEQTGIPLKLKKKFTKTNKFIVRIKTRMGIIGIALFAPLFLSVPIGTIITAKFYGKEKKTFPLIVLGMFVNGVAITFLAYFFY